jgi:hypothetical protein
MIIGGVIGGLSYSPCDPKPSLWGLSDCDLEIFPQSFFIVMGALAGAEIIGGLGFLIGYSYKKFKIEGNPDLYRQKRNDMEKYLYPIRSQL